MDKTMRAGLLCAFLLAFTGAAHGLNVRTWIASTGVDTAGCGPVASPCRTLQYAHDVTAPDGEIDVRDAAGYGSLVITKAISIIGDGSLSGVLAPAGGNAITVNAGSSDSVVLRGLTIEGAGIGANGIVFASGRRLTVANCSVRNFVGGGPFTGNGILIQPSAATVANEPDIVITNTNSSHNGYFGLYVFNDTSNNEQHALPRIKLKVAITGVTTVDNVYGVGIVDTFGVVDQAFGLRASISNTLVSNNKNDGMFLAGANTKVMLDFCGADRNGDNGIRIGSGVATIGRSRASNNGAYGLSSAGTTTSFKNNQFSGNASGATLPVSLPQEPSL